MGFADRIARHVDCGRCFEVIERRGLRRIDHLFQVFVKLRVETRLGFVDIFPSFLKCDVWGFADEYFARTSLLKDIG